MFGLFGRKIVRGTFRVVQASCTVFFFCEHVANLVKCTGPSMEPTIYTNDIVLCEHVTKSIMRGDIVIACSTNDPTVNVCKRVLAIAGDIIHMGGREMMIPTGYIWLQGDNLYNSTDSRNYGPIPLGLVRGRVLAKVWPLSKFTLFDKNPNLKP